MALEKKMGKLSTLTGRQKVIAIALVVVVIFVGWQIIDLMGGSRSDSTSAPITPVASKKSATAAMTANAPGAVGVAPQGNNPPAMPGTSPSAMQNQAPPEQPILRETLVSVDAQILDLQKKSEQKYVDQINQLQMLKIQREIAETNQAIASARLATVTAEKNVSDLLTKPSVQPAPQVSPYAAMLPGAPTDLNMPPPPLAQGQPPVPVEAPYAVISVSMQLGRWSAVVTFQGKMFNVSIGDVLPVDGSIVVSINKNGITLMKNNKRRRVGIVSSI